MEWRTAVGTLPYCCYPVIPLSCHLSFAGICLFGLGHLTLGYVFLFAYCFDHFTPFSFILNKISFSQIMAAGAAKGRGRLHREVSDENFSFWTTAEDLGLRFSLKP